MQDKNKSYFVHVVARIKPNLEDPPTEDCLEITTNPPLITIPERQQTYVLDHIFDQDAGQGTIYENTVKHLVDKLLLGYNCTVFAYGQTGSGKTYTMGTDGAIPEESERGIIIRTIVDILTRNNIETNINVSFSEIYNEKVYDLLSLKDRDKLIPLKVKGFGVSDLIRKPVRSFVEGLTYLKSGVERRHKGGTKQNAASSRSHAIFTIYVNVKNENTEFDVKLNLVDLAGSECQKRSRTEGPIFHEGVNINLGLLSIGQVISALTKAANSNHVPYRESVITTVLKDSLNRNNYITLIACVSANSADISDTIQTLEFAQRAKKLKSKPELNILEQNKPPNTPASLYIRSIHNKRPHPRTPLKRPPLFTTSFNNNSSNQKRPYLSTPSLHSFRPTAKNDNSTTLNALKTSVSSLNVNLLGSVVPLSSTFMSDLNCSLSSASSSVASSRLDVTALSPMIREYLKTIHNDAMVKIDNAIQEKLDTLSKLNLTTAEIVKIREVLEVSSDRTRKNLFSLESEECSIPNQYSTFVENLATPNRKTRTNLQELFENDDNAIFKIPKPLPLPRKRKVLNEAREGEMQIEVSPAKRRRSVRLQEKTVNTENSEADNLTNKSTSYFKEVEVANRRRSVRLSTKLLVGKKTQSEVKSTPIAARRRIVVCTPKDNYNRILNILNYGTEKSMMELSTIGTKTAKQIYLYRSINGKFDKISDLSGLPWKGKSYQRFIQSNFLEIEDEH